VIVHVVLFSPKAGLSGDERATFANQVVDSLRQVPFVSRAVLGRAFTVDAGYSRDLGAAVFEFVAVLEFRDEEALVGYLNHPLHHTLGAAFWRHCSSTVITEADAAAVGDDRVLELLTR
jgi:hypothetical protein